MRRVRALLLVLVGALTAAFVTACGTGQTGTGAAAPTAASSAAMTMETSTAGMGTAMAMEQSDAPFDARFLDGMMVHHQGAVTMAEQARTKATRSEIKQLADNIIASQQAESMQMQTWRKQWYPDLAPTGGVDMDMGEMQVADGSAPYDQRFMQAMIPHHESAIAMAKDAQQQAQHQEIKDLAGKIITAQEGEIAQMRQWLRDWYNVQ